MLFVAMHFGSAHGPPRLPAPRALLRLRISGRLTRATSQDRLHGQPPLGTRSREARPASGPFGEELAVLSWADRLAAQGPRLKPEHVERHRELCVEFLSYSRDLGPYPEPDYERIAGQLNHPPAADAGYAASRTRLLTARGLAEDAAVRRVVGLMGHGEGPEEVRGPELR